MIRPYNDDAIMNVIAAYFRKHGYAPTNKEIAELMGYCSATSIKTRINRLYDKGYLETDLSEDIPRAFRISPKYMQKYGGVNYEWE